MRAKSTAQNWLHIGAILLVLVVAVVTATWLSNISLFETRTAETNLIVAPSTQAAKYSLDMGQPLDGTPFVRFELKREAPESANFGSGSYDRYQTVNMLVVRDDIATARWVFDGVDQQVWTMMLLRAPDMGMGWRENGKVIALVMQVAKRDTNTDGKVDGHDRSSLVVDKLDGTPLVTLMADLDALRWWHQNDAGDLFTVYEVGGASFGAVFSARDFKLLTRNELPRLSTAHPTAPSAAGNPGIPAVPQ